ncbi:hypothetical protein VTN77DRAFT_831 [Rasamsonia byssochlamydoides]|uniref:uncharacterized protein n=1 Tax=Rasamsonia byssochlamydoides TaxID=89139 RepID=UPI0037420368
MTVIQNPTIRNHARSYLPLAPCHASTSTSAAARWRAVTTRDASANTFVYAVRSTRIYCRPSCPARLARRANIEFFDTPAQAEAAGFRPCKRCTPHLHVRDDPQVRVVQRARDTIAAAVSSGQRPKLQELAAEANLTPSHFHRVFKKIAGITPGQYARTIREEKNNGGEIGREGVENDDPTPPLEFDDSNQLVGLWQSRLDAAVLPENDVSLDDLIDWDKFDAMMAREQLNAGELGSDPADGLLRDIPQTGSV